MGDFDEFGELYVDLEGREIDSFPAVEADDGDKSEPEEKESGFENGTIDSHNSSDSEDDLQIVLNEEDCLNKPAFQLIAEGMDYEEDEGDDLSVSTRADCFGFEAKISKLGQSVDRLMGRNIERGNATKGTPRNTLIPCSSGSVVRSGRGHWEHLTMPGSFANVSYNLGYPTTFSNGGEFYLPRNRSIFDFDFESFECKPWSYNGVDITDYFNFGLDVESWRTYCKQLNMLLVHQSSKFNKAPGEVARQGSDNGHDILDNLQNERKGIKMPRGRAIHVETGNGDRIPSIDVRRPRNQDSDVVIQITTGHGVEDALDPIKDQNVDDKTSKNEILLSSSNELCKSSFSAVLCAPKCEGSTNCSESPHQFMKKALDESLDNVKFSSGKSSRKLFLTKPDVVVADHYSSSSKSLDHNDSKKSSKDDTGLEKFSSPERLHLNSDYWFQESVLSDCYLSDETRSDAGKLDRTICGVDYPESSPDLSSSQLATPHKLVKLNLSSDGEVASHPVYRQKIVGKHRRNESDTVVSKHGDNTNARSHKSRGVDVLLRNKMKGYKGKEFKNASSVARLNNHEDPVNREKRFTLREEFRGKKNVLYVNRRAQNNSRGQNDIVDRSCLQLNSGNIFLYDRKSFYTARRAGEHDMEACYKTVESKCRRRKRTSSDCRERSLYECRERSLDEYRNSSLNVYRESSLNKRREKSLNECRARTLDEYFGNSSEDEESSINKYHRVHSSAGESRRFHEFYSYGNNLHADLDSPNRYADNHEDSGLCIGSLHPRIYRGTYHADERDCHADYSHRNQVTSLISPGKRYISHSGRTLETFSRMSNEHLLFSSKKCCKNSSRIAFDFDHDQSAEVRASYPGNCSYYERRKCGLLLPGLLAKKQVSCRNIASKSSSSPKRYSLYGTEHHHQYQNGRADNDSLNRKKVSGNNCRSNSGNEFNLSSRKDSYFSASVGRLLDEFVKDRHEEDNMDCREAVHKPLNGWKIKSKVSCGANGGRHQFDDDLTDFKASEKSGGAEGWPPNTKKMSSILSCHKKEMDELEEGQLVEESDHSETAAVKFNPDERAPSSTANIEITNPRQKNNSDGSYDQNHLLETLAKMEKRRERFKDVVLLKKNAENIIFVAQPDTATKDEIKQQRPARKRRWCGS